MRTLYELITDPGYHLFWNWRTDSQSEGIARASLSAAEIFDVQNVHDYYYSFPLGSTFSFPNVAPAFESMWFEWESDHTPDRLMARIGVLMQAIKKDHGWDVFSMFFSHHGEDIGPTRYISRFKSDASGQLIEMNGYNSWIKFTPYVKANEYELLTTAMDVTLQICWLALSFMHCKNVKIIENPPHKSPSGRNKHGPRITFKTLEIEPMKRILREEGGSEKTGLKRALHICRGHFKDFSNGRGLFGRNHGLYWWDSQVRGKFENGIVFKDYAVKPPEAAHDRR